MKNRYIMSTTIQPTYDDMLPSDLATLEAVESPHILALWYRCLNSWEWPEELAPCEPNPVGTPLWKNHEEWKASMPDRRDDITEWIKNKVGPKYLLMVWQCELMLSNIAPEMSPSEMAFENWWKEPDPRDPSWTKGESHLRHTEWWTKTREEWRRDRKARL